MEKPGEMDGNFFFFFGRDESTEERAMERREMQNYSLCSVLSIK